LRRCSRFSALAVLFVPLGVLLFDAFWTARSRQPSCPRGGLLGSDRRAFVEAAALSADQRRELLQRVVLVGALVGVAVSAPLVMALYYTRCGSCSA